MGASAGESLGSAAESKLLDSYAVISGFFAAAMSGLLVHAARSGRLPRSVSPGDLLLLGTATYKLSRIVSRTKVTRWLRAPFTPFDEAAHLNEVNESPCGGGLQRAVGELLGCPLCLDAWVGALMLGALFTARGPPVQLPRCLQ